MPETSTQFGSSKRALLLISVLLVGSAAIDFTSIPAQASPDTSISTASKQARGQVPGRRRGRARRVECPTTAGELTALVPITEVQTQTLPETYVGGRTTAEHPTFWFYVPHSLTADLSAEFLLQDDTGEEIYRVASSEFSASEPIPGVISISLPSMIAPLEIGRVYQWYFKLNCRSEVPIYVQGGVERISLDPNLSNQLANASPQEQATLYSANNIWYDAVNVSAQLYYTNPTDAAIESAWIELLQSLGLEEDIPLN